MDRSQIYTKAGLREVIDTLPLAISVIDRYRKVALANKRTHGFVSRHETELIGQTGGKAFGCIHHDDVPEGCGFGPTCTDCRLRQTVSDTMQEKCSHYLVEATMSFQSIGERHLQISTMPMALNAEDYVLLCLEDITETKNHAQAKPGQEQLAIVLEAAGAASQELSQPLTSVSGYTQLLLMDIDPENPIHAELQKIKAQVDRMGHITKKLMQISKYCTKIYFKGKIIDLDQAAAF